MRNPLTVAFDWGSVCCSRGDWPRNWAHPHLRILFSRKGYWVQVQSTFAKRIFFGWMKSKATFIWCFRAGDWLKSCIKDQNQNFNGLKNFGNVSTRLKWTLFLRAKTSFNLFVGAFWRTSRFGVCWQSRQPEVRRRSHIQGWISLQIGCRLPGMTPMLSISGESRFHFYFLIFRLPKTMVSRGWCRLTTLTIVTRDPLEVSQTEELGTAETAGFVSTGGRQSETLCRYKNRFRKIQ